MTTRLTFNRWEGGPRGHVVPLGIATFDEDGTLILADVAVALHFNAAGVRTLADAQHIFRSGQTSSAYGWPFITETEPDA